MKSNSNQLNRTRQAGAWQRLPWLIVPLFAVALLTGCNQQAKVIPNGEDTKRPAAVNPVGTYALVSVDGKKVPCSVQHDGHSMTVDSGAFVINGDGTCSSRISLAGRGSPIEVKADYTVEGSTLTMRWQGAGVTTGTVQGDAFTMNNEGMEFAYRK